MLSVSVKCLSIPQSDADLNFENWAFCNTTVHSRDKFLSGVSTKYTICVIMKV